LAFSVEYTDEAMGSLEKLELPEVMQLSEKIRKAAKNPLEHFTRVKSREIYELKAAGGYVVLSKLNMVENKLVILTVGAKRDAYA
jgi:mRNA-degrading endonuclease RelE of RelBE toxin-antitoxin system